MLRSRKNSSLVRRFSTAALVLAALTMGGCGDIHERTEFTGLVMGKSSEEVLAKVGKPAAVDASNPAREVWTFNHATFDLGNHNRGDAKTVVILEPKGDPESLVVADVKFQP